MKIRSCKCAWCVGNKQHKNNKKLYPIEEGLQEHIEATDESHEDLLEKEENKSNNPLES